MGCSSCALAVEDLQAGEIARACGDAPAHVGTRLAPPTRAGLVKGWKNGRFVREARRSGREARAVERTHSLDVLVTLPLG